MNEKKAASKTACALQALPRSELVIEVLLSMRDLRSTKHGFLAMGVIPLVPVAPAAVTNCNVFHLWLSWHVFLFCRSVEDDDRDRWIHV